MSTIPGVISSSIKYYDEKGELHREDGPAQIYKNGTKKWYKHGHLHREDGPAIEWGGVYQKESWFFNGQCHRIDGPATTFKNGNQYWWYHGKRIPCSSQKEFEKLIKLQAFW